MYTSKRMIGGVVGAALALVWIASSGLGVLLVAAMALAGFIVGSVAENPSRLIALLQRLQDE